MAPRGVGFAPFSSSQQAALVLQGDGASELLSSGCDTAPISAENQAEAEEHVGSRRRLSPEALPAAR